LEIFLKAQRENKGLQSYLRAGGAITFPDIENEVDRTTLFIGKCYNFCELCVQITLSMRRSILNQRYEKVKSLNIGFLLIVISDRIF
jgi:hypothetical protein